MLALALTIWFTFAASVNTMQSYELRSGKTVYFRIDVVHSKRESPHELKKKRDFWNTYYEELEGNSTRFRHWLSAQKTYLSDSEFHGLQAHINDLNGGTYAYDRFMREADHVFKRKPDYPRHERYIVYVTMTPDPLPYDLANSGPIEIFSNILMSVGVHQYFEKNQIQHRGIVRNPLPWAEREKYTGLSMLLHAFSGEIFGKKWLSIRRPWNNMDQILRSKMPEGAMFIGLVNGKRKREGRFKPKLYRDEK